MIYIKIKHILAGGMSVIYLCVLCGTGILISTDKEQISNITIQNSTAVIPITSIPTTQTTATTSITTVTTTVITTDNIETEYSNEVFETEPDYETTVVYEESDDEYCESESETIYEESYTDYSWYTAKWYSGSVGAYGYSGRELISGYSVASPDFPQGTLLQIVGGGLDGIYRVDDTGCPSGVIDFFYYYDDVPEHFEYNGVYDIQVSVVE